MEPDWTGNFERERARFEDGIARLPDTTDPDERQRQLTRVANALYGAGLALLMQGSSTEAADCLLQAAERYRESYPAAPLSSWGRPIGAMKARVIAGEWAGAAADARWALDEGAAAAESPIGRYAASLALLVLGDDIGALEAARSLRGSDFPGDVARSLLALADADQSAYEEAIGDVLRSFETRDEYLEDIAVADTVVVLEALAHRRGVGAGLESPLLPAQP